MLFAHDTAEALGAAADLVNTELDGEDLLRRTDQLTEHLIRWEFTGEHLGTAAELDSVRRLRTRLRPLWTVADRDDAAREVNQILRDTDARPYLDRHGGWDWHLHVTEPTAPLANRLGAEAAMAFLDLIRTDDWDRVRLCAAEDCDAVLVDLSRNRSKRYCDTGNCGNRANVAAYRARRRASG